MGEIANISESTLSDGSKVYSVTVDAAGVVIDMDCTSEQRAMALCDAINTYATFASIRKG